MHTESGLPKSEIREELDKILTGKVFSKSPLLTRFLRFVVEKTLDGRSNQIKEYTVGISVLDKPHSFNPQTDASVRIHAIRLRKMLEEYYVENPLHGNIRISLPKGSYVPSFSKESLDDLNHKTNEKTGFAKGKDTQPEDSICVVPFNGLVKSKTLDFSLEGFSNYLTQQLSLFQDITVKSYYSVTSHLKQGGSIEQIGNTLDVTYYLTGNIEVSDESMLVSIQLFEAKTNTFIWSQDFSDEGEKDSISDIINHIAHKIVASLAGYSGIIHYKKFLSPDNSPVLSNTQANAVFWFYHYLTHQNFLTFKKAVSELEQSVQLNPNSSLSWSVLAMLYTDSVFFDYETGLDHPLSRAQAYVARALSINPNCQHGNVSAGWINIFLRNKDAARQSLKKSVNINPNASYFTAACSLGMSLLGEYEESELYLEKTIPQHPLPYWWLSLPPIFMALKKKDYQKMLFHARKMGTPAGVQEHIFEMIGLYYLDETEKLHTVLKIYTDRHPNGIEHAIQSWPMILFDDDLVEQITFALKEINLLKPANPQ